MKIACLQLNPIVGDIPGNLAKAKQAIATVQEFADVIVLTELFVTGYPPRDLLLWHDFIDENLAAKQELVNHTANFKGALVFGYVEINNENGGKPLFNAACVAQGGKVIQQRYKTLLPTYDVFAERRYFQPGDEADIKPVELTTLDGKKIPVGIIICEEAWNDAEYWKTREYPFDPVKLMADRGALHIISINASPYRYEGEKSISHTRRQMIARHCLDLGIGITYVNQVGGNDDVIFDGNSFSMDTNGDVLAHANHCEQDSMFVNLSLNRCVSPKTFTRPLEEDILRVLIRGTKDYFEKQPFLREGWLGLSGGLDSAMVGFLATQAIGANRVITFGMPSEFSSTGSVTDAQKAAERSGYDYYMAPIAEPHNAFRHVFDDVLTQMCKKRSTHLNGRLISGMTSESGVVDQNIQARTRDLLLMIGANKFNGLLLLTGNKSESAVGYYTLYDMCGGLGVVADVYKTMLYRLARYINATAKDEIIPWATIIKKPSAELAANQTDQDTLPPYEWMDPWLVRFIEDQQSTRQIIAEVATVENIAKYAHETNELIGRPRNLVNDIRWTTGTVIKQNWKRDQSARGLKVTKRHFKFGWEVPIVQRATL